MNTLGKFFQKELEGKTFPTVLLDGEITNFSVNRGDRAVKISARFSEFVEYAELLRLSEALEGPAFGLSTVKLLPRFPGEAFSAKCVTSLVLALKELDATLNGTFKQAEAEYREGKLSIRLAHGGYDLLAAHNTDLKLKELVREWFGVDCAVEVTGKLAVKEGEGSLLEQVRTEETKRRREAAIQEMEEYEEALQERASRRKLSIREGETLMPTIIP